MNRDIVVVAVLFIGCSGIAADEIDYRQVAEEFAKCYGATMAAEDIYNAMGITATAQAMGEIGNGAAISGAYLLSLNAQASGKDSGTIGDYMPYIESLAGPYRNSILALAELSLANDDPVMAIEALAKGLAICDLLSDLQEELVQAIRRESYGID